MDNLVRTRQRKRWHVSRNSRTGNLLVAAPLAPWRNELSKRLLRFLRFPKWLVCWIFAYNVGMPAKRKISKARPVIAPLLPSAEELRETPEWIARLRSRVQEEAPTKREWAERAVNLILELMDLSEAALSKAADAPDNWHAMFLAMRNAETLEQIQKSDPLARAFLDGLDAKARLIEQNGGVFKTDQVAEYLGITPQAVNKRHALRQLVGLTFRKRGHVFPAWQFTDRGTVPGLDQVLRVLASHDEWMQNVFFINPNTRLYGRRPLDLLREGEIQEVVDAAREFGQHGAP